MSADPYLRPGMKSNGTTKVGTIINGFVSGKVVRSQNPEWKEGDVSLSSKFVILIYRSIRIKKISYINKILLINRIDIFIFTAFWCPPPILHCSNNPK
jgi:NADPH-dependent curcumin reductase CurA